MAIVVLAIVLWRRNSASSSGARGVEGEVAADGWTTLVRLRDGARTTASEAFSPLQKYSRRFRSRLAISQSHQPGPTLGCGVPVDASGIPSEAVPLQPATSAADEKTAAGLTSSPQVRVSLALSGLGVICSIVCDDAARAESPSADRTRSPRQARFMKVSGPESPLRDDAAGTEGSGDEGNRSPSQARFMKSATRPKSPLQPDDDTRLMSRLRPNDIEVPRSPPGTRGLLPGRLDTPGRAAVARTMARIRSSMGSSSSV